MIWWNCSAMQLTIWVFSLCATIHGSAASQGCMYMVVGRLMTGPGINSTWKNILPCSGSLLPLKTYIREACFFPQAIANILSYLIGPWWFWPGHNPSQSLCKAGGIISTGLDVSISPCCWACPPNWMIAIQLEKDGLDIWGETWIHENSFRFIIFSFSPF